MFFAGTGKKVKEKRMKVRSFKSGDPRYSLTSSTSFKQTITVRINSKWGVFTAHSMHTSVHESLRHARNGLEECRLERHLAHQGLEPQGVVLALFLQPVQHLRAVPLHLVLVRPTLPRKTQTQWEAAPSADVHVRLVLIPYCIHGWSVV